jgi:hypothetical protein
MYFLQVFSESKLIRVVVQLGAVKIYVAALEALRKRERQDETQFTPLNTTLVPWPI